MGILVQNASVLRASLLNANCANFITARTCTEEKMFRVQKNKSWKKKEKKPTFPTQMKISKKKKKSSQNNILVWMLAKKIDQL